MPGVFRTAVSVAQQGCFLVSVSDELQSFQIGDTRVDFLGTAHVSRVSREQVARLLASGDYDAVAVELCDRRHEAIVDPEAIARVDLGQVIRERKLGAMATLVGLNAYQQRLADYLGVELGGEMKEAVRFARDHGLGLALIDRDVGVTLKRLYRSVPWWRRMALVNSLLFSVFSRHKISEVHVEQMKQSDILTGMFQELQVLDPRLYDALITERDRYMAAKTISYARREKPARVLAVVGAGHLPGLVQQLPRRLPQETDSLVDELAELDKVPPSPRWIKFIPWVVVGVILAGFAAGFSQDTALGLELVLDWILINGSLAAFGAVIAGAHPLTAVTAFLAAPLTSINPTVGAGMVTAAMEVYLRKPTIADFENIRKDTVHWSGWRRNRVARTLLIFVFSTLGSAIGTYVGGFHIYDSL